MRILSEVHSYILRYKIRGLRLTEAASDVLDGGHDREELEELIRKRLLEVIQFDEYERGLGRCYHTLRGSSWTVAATDKAINLFWPERKEDGPSPTHKRRLPRASVRKGQLPMRNVRKRRAGRTPYNGKKTVPRRRLLP